MKRINVSKNVIRRLPRYLRRLEDLSRRGVQRISSGELAVQMGLTASQIRQDFSNFGEFGQQGYGYNVETLRHAISEILGRSQGYSAILIGVGNLGSALLGNFNFEAAGFKMKAAFDVAPRLIGKEHFGVMVHHSDTLEEYLKHEKTDMAVLTVPQALANTISHSLITGGIRSIWNFTNVELHNPADSGVVIESVHFSDSLLTLSYYLTN